MISYFLNRKSKVQDSKVKINQIEYLNLTELDWIWLNEHNWKQLNIIEQLVCLKATYWTKSKVKSIICVQHCVKTNLLSKLPQSNQQHNTTHLGCVVLLLLKKPHHHYHHHTMMWLHFKPLNFFENGRRPPQKN